jgi:hypothetical protein
VKSVSLLNTAYWGYRKECHWLAPLRVSLELPCVLFPVFSSSCLVTWEPTLAKAFKAGCHGSGCEKEMRGTRQQAERAKPVAFGMGLTKLHEKRKPAEYNVPRLANLGSDTCRGTFRQAYREWRCYRSRDSAFGVVAMLRVGRSAVRGPAGVDYYLLRNVPTGRGAHPAYWVGTGVPSRG